MTVSQGVDKDPKLIFFANGNLETVIIKSEEWEGHQYKIWFRRDRKNKIYVYRFESIGEYPSTEILPHCFNPALKEAKTRFAIYYPSSHRNRSKKKKTMVPPVTGEQAQLL